MAGLGSRIKRSIILRVRSARRDSRWASASLPEKLFDRAFPLPRGVQPVLMAVELGVRERDPPQRLSEDLRRSGVSVSPEIEAGRRAHVRVTPAVQDDSGDVSA